MLKGMWFGMLLSLLALGVSILYMRQVIVLEDEGKERILTQEEIDGSVSVQTVLPQTITAQTEFIIREINYNTGEQVENKKTIADKYMGMTRGEFCQSINDSNSTMRLKEVEKGLLNMCVVSFSKDRVVVQASYKKDDYHDGYYLCVYNHKLIVYLSDMQTVAMTTDILLEELPMVYQMQIMDGMFIQTEQEIYGLFENYTS